MSNSFTTVPLSVAVEAYKWLVCYLLKESHRRLSEQSAEGKDSFTARNDSQAYYCRSLALAYIEVCDTCVSFKLCLW